MLESMPACESLLFVGLFAKVLSPLGHLGAKGLAGSSHAGASSFFLPINADGSGFLPAEGPPAGICCEAT